MFKKEFLKMLSVGIATLMLGSNALCASPNTFSKNDKSTKVKIGLGVGVPLTLPFLAYDIHKFMSSDNQDPIGREVPTTYRPGEIGKALEINEENMVISPDKYFSIDNSSGECIVKNEKGVSRSAGKFELTNLGKLREDSTVSSGGKVTVVYGNTKQGCSALGIENLLCDERIEAVNIPSNHNGIETVGTGDDENNKRLCHYVFDHTAAPAAMYMFYRTSLALLYAQPILFSSENFENGSRFVNFLRPYNLNLQNGYVTDKSDTIEGNLGSDSDEGNDKFTFVTVKDAPLYLQGGSLWSEVPHKVCDGSRKCHIFIDAGIPAEVSRYPHGSEAACKLHLKRHYLAYVNFCRKNQVKCALVSLLGAGVFGNSLAWHAEILNDPKVKEAIEESGTHFIINAFRDEDFWSSQGNHSLNAQAIGCKKDLNSVLS